MQLDNKEKENDEVRESKAFLKLVLHGYKLYHNVENTLQSRTATRSDFKEPLQSLQKVEPGPFCATAASRKICKTSC